MEEPLQAVRDLSPIELQACLAGFTEQWDIAAGEGRHRMAAFYQGVALLLAEERDRRRREWRNVQEKVMPDGIESEPATWWEGEGDNGD